MKRQMIRYVKRGGERVEDDNKGMKSNSDAHPASQVIRFQLCEEARRGGEEERRGGDERIG